MGQEIQVVVGSKGFIGQNLIRRLQVDFEVVIKVDRLIPSDDYEVNCDNSWPDVVADKISTYAKQQFRIWHLAANSDIRKSASDPDLDYIDTLGSSLQVIRLAAKLKEYCTGILFTSSSSVYGQGTNQRFTEESNLLPKSYYGVMKLASENAFRIFQERYNINCHILRLPNVVGPNMTHGVIFDLLNKISVNSQILNVLGDGNQRKVYIHVEDLVDFMQDIIKFKEGITLNISNSDDGLAVKEIVTEILNIIGIETEVIYENKQEGWPGDVTICLMDNSKMRKFANLEFRSSKDSVKDAIISRLGEIKLCSV